LLVLGRSPIGNICIPGSQAHPAGNRPRMLWSIEHDIRRHIRGRQASFRRVLHAKGVRCSTENRVTQSKADRMTSRFLHSRRKLVRYQARGYLSWLSRRPEILSWTWRSMIGQLRRGIASHRDTCILRSRRRINEEVGSRRPRSEPWRTAVVQTHAHCRSSLEQI